MDQATAERFRARQQFRNAFGLAMDSIRSHKLRSFLTLLGVIIGVASVILVGSAISGLGVYAEQSTAKAFGSESFMVAQIAATGRLSRRQYFDKIKRNKPIRRDDARFLESVAGDEVMYSPYRNHVSDVKRENQICEDTTIIGVSADMAEIRDIGVVEGRFFTSQEDQSRALVAVVGDTVRSTLFPGDASPIDGIIRIEGLEFRVVGLEERLGSAFGQNQDKNVYIPITAFDRMYGPGTGFALFGRPRPGSGLKLQDALDLTRVALRTRFHARPGQDDNFDTLTPDAIRGFIDQVLGMIAAVVVPVTCISLVVGGIVIMNIMLVSVTERTREIGIRKALGARHGDVMMQVLIEAVVLSIMGGATGVALGALATLLLGQIFSLSLHITMGYVVLSLGVSSVVGVVSGWYPASRAARLDPVVALARSDAMNISATENMQMAVQAVWTHRFRSLLTILGIVIGITTVVTVASLLTGLRKGVVVFFQELGPDNVFLYKSSGDPSLDPPPKERKRRALKPEYAAYVQRWCRSVQDVAIELYLPAVIDGNPLTARVPGYESDTINVEGVTANMYSISPRDFSGGRFFTPEEEERGAHVVMIGANVADSLFPDGRAVNRTLMMDGAEYAVIGVYAKAKGGFFGENGQDNAIVMPLRTAQSRYPQIDRFMIIAKAFPGKRQDAFYEVEGAMRRLRHLPTDAADDFSISTPDQIIQQFDSITSLIGLVAIAISALGLLVGGIGVMNIMLVSVTERTREIGVRKALGARRRDIVGQFLVEAMTLTGAGGVIGILIAVLLTMLVGVLVPSLPSTVPAWALITGFTVSVAVGVFFGVWPAMKASQLDPVDALRYE